MSEPKRIHVKLSFDMSNPIRVHTDLSMFAQTSVKKTPDRKQIETFRNLSKNFIIDKAAFKDFLEKV